MKAPHRSGVSFGGLPKARSAASAPDWPITSIRMWPWFEPRVAWSGLSIWPGAVVLGVVAYLAAWLLMPRAEAVDGASAAPQPRLVRSRTDRRIAGVCGGLAEYFDVDPTIVRVTWVILSIVAGAIVFGVVAYLIAWFIIPPAPAAAWQASPSTT